MAFYQHNQRLFKAVDNPLLYFFKITFPTGFQTSILSTRCERVYGFSLLSCPRYKICYQVELSERRFTCFEVSTAVPHLLLNNLEAGTEYSIKMAAATHVGFGPYSQWAIIRTMAIENCTGPDTLQVVPNVVNSTTVEVTWSLPASTTASTPDPEGRTGLLGFKLTLTALRDRSQQMRVFPVHARSTILGNLEPAMAYNLVMQGYSHCGEGHVTGVTFQLPQATDGQNRPILLAPFDLRGAAISATAITLQWQRPQTSFQVDFYMVYGEPSRKAYSRSFERRSTICAATIRDLTPFTEYVLRVKAFGGDMESVYSHQIYLKTLEDVPSEPTHFSVVPFNGLDVTTVVKVKWQPPHSPNGVIVEYQVSYSAINRTQLDPARQIVSTNGTTHQVVVYNLKAGYHYIFRVKAFTSVGGGASSTPLLYVVKEHPMTTGTPLDRPFDGLGGELEKGIVAGIILATICIMICTLLLVVRHRRDCHHQFCVTDKEGSQANHMEMVGQADPLTYRFTTPCRNMLVISIPIVQRKRMERMVSVANAINADPDLQIHDDLNNLPQCA
ncbi:protogenin A-like [Diadema antillarum]|uniref:protogenin A-like n=1 Tax=Diadema antillarum TaxID=105358 RepID=UPI003A855E8D